MGRWLRGGRRRKTFRLSNGGAGEADRIGCDDLFERHRVAVGLGPSVACIEQHKDRRIRRRLREPAQRGAILWLKRAERAGCGAQRPKHNRNALRASASGPIHLVTQGGLALCEAGRAAEPRDGDPGSCLAAGSKRPLDGVVDDVAQSAASRGADSIELGDDPTRAIESLADGVSFVRPAEANCSERVERERTGRLHGARAAGVPKWMHGHGCDVVTRGSHLAQFVAGRVPVDPER